jgi:hypothetical protein
MAGIRTAVTHADLSLPFPTEWTEAGAVEKIVIYPLKSAKGREVDSAQVRAHLMSRADSTEKSI